MADTQMTNGNTRSPGIPDTGRQNAKADPEVGTAGLALWRKGLALIIMVVMCSTLLVAAPASAETHRIEGKKVDISFNDTNLFFYRGQSVSVKVNPKRHWYCLWQCSSTSKIDSISGSVEFFGPVVPAVRRTKSCTRCGSLTLRAPSYWGINVPKAYTNATYRIDVVIDGRSYRRQGRLPDRAW